MIKIVLIPVLIILISCDQNQKEANVLQKEKSEQDLTINTNQQSEEYLLNNKISLGSYTGKIGSKLGVIFQLNNVEGSISGFYYYLNKGIDIALTGKMDKDGLLIYELDHKNDTIAVMRLKIKDSTLTGNWKSTRTESQYNLTLNRSGNDIQKIPRKILGVYKDAACNLTLTITQSKGQYYYHYKSDERNLRGPVYFSREENEIYLTLENIEYAEDFFDISLPEESEQSEEYEKLREIGKRKVGIDCYYSQDEILIQNYGNSMNYYLKLYDCGEKYIHLVKI